MWHQSSSKTLPLVFSSSWICQNSLLLLCSCILALPRGLICQDILLYCSCMFALPCGLICIDSLLYCGCMLALPYGQICMDTLLYCSCMLANSATLAAGTQSGLRWSVCCATGGV